MMNDSSSEMSFSCEYKALRFEASTSADALAINCAYWSFLKRELFELGSVARPLFNVELGSSWAKVELARYMPLYLRLTASSTQIASSSARMLSFTPILERSA